MLAMLNRIKRGYGLAAVFRKAEGKPRGRNQQSR
jgi:hypothetical protein